MILCKTLALLIQIWEIPKTLQNININNFSIDEDAIIFELI